jgi:hypothetical protein
MSIGALRPRRRLRGWLRGDARGVARATRQARAGRGGRRAAAPTARALTAASLDPELAVRVRGFLQDARERDRRDQSRRIPAESPGARTESLRHVTEPTLRQSLTLVPEDLRIRESNEAVFAPQLLARLGAGCEVALVLVARKLLLAGALLGVEGLRGHGAAYHRGRGNRRGTGSVAALHCISQSWVHARQRPQSARAGHSPAMDQAPVRGSISIATRFPRLRTRLRPMQRTPPISASTRR